MTNELQGKVRNTFGHKLIINSGPNQIKVMGFETTRGVVEWNDSLGIIDTQANILGGHEFYYNAFDEAIIVRMADGF